LESFIIMTCNVGNNRAAPEQLIPVVRDSGADLVGFQELSDIQAEALSTELGGDYPHQALYPGGFAGKAVLSRYPILESEQLHLSTVRPDLQAKIDINGKEITFIVAHPPPPRPHLGDFNLADWWGEYAYLRSTGLKDAFLEAGEDRGHTLPTRIGPWKRLLTLNRFLRGLPLTPIFRVDYIWYTEPFSCQRAWVGEDTGSDHLPVLAKLFM
jgi:endonuclease/exonuclease/phosphatase family metal-dependent hydrolase